MNNPAAAFAKSIATYGPRSEACVRVLAAACGGSPDTEAARFHHIRETLGPMALLAGVAMPVAYEMVLTLARGKPRGFAYLTQGTAGSSFPESMTRLLQRLLQLHLAQDAAALQDAELTADLFRIAFPSLPQLHGFSPLSQGLLVGFVPRGERFELKLYFNTRIDTSVAHRDKVLQMVALCGGDVTETGALYDSLYSARTDTTFSGVGVDVADREGRAKLYVHAPREGTAELIRHIAPDSSCGAVDLLLETTESDASSSTCEIAFAVRGTGAPPTLKLTVFYGGKLIQPSDQERAVALLERWGYASDVVREAIATLHVDGAQSQRYPLHGLGIEIAGDANPKVNVYLKPAL